MTTKIIGTDVSFYQDDPHTARGIDFAQMKRAGAAFTIIRAGQNLWEDNEFDISWSAARGILPRGSYWFYDSRIEPKLQARKWHACFADPDDVGEFGLWCDFEDRYGGTWGGWKHWYTFIEEVKRLFPGQKIGIYTGFYYWKEHTLGANIPAVSLNYFRQYPLWIAAYNPVAPEVPKPWDTWTLWQYTDNGDGKRYGAESLNIDLNYFNGGEDDLSAFLGGAQIEQPPAEEDLPASVRLLTASGKVAVMTR